MTRIDFYIPAQDRPHAREHLSCRLAEKIYRLGQRVYLHTESEAHAALVDDLLWTFRAGSFLPHGRCDERGDPAPPVVVGCDAQPCPPAEVLINLTAAVPPFFDAFERVAEIIDAGDAGRRSARERYRYYRDRGYPLHTHTLGRE